MIQEGGVVFLRVVLDMLSYYNAKYMYSLTGKEYISPLTCVYINHSFGIIIFIRDLITYKSQYIEAFYIQTGTSFKRFFLFIVLISPVYNLGGLPKFFSMNKVEDTTIITIYGASVIFTYILTIVMLDDKICSAGILSILLGILAILLTFFVGETKNNFGLICLLILSSMLCGFFTVFFSMYMKYSRSIVHQYLNSRKLNFNNQEAPIDFYDANDASSMSSSTFISMEGNLKVIPIKDMDSNTEYMHTLYFVKQFFSIMGVTTMIFYYPLLLVLQKSGFVNCNFPNTLKPYFFVLVSCVISFIHTLIYFIIILKTNALFAQLSGIIIQPVYVVIKCILEGNQYDNLISMASCMCSCFSLGIMGNLSRCE